MSTEEQPDRRAALELLSDAELKSRLDRLSSRRDTISEKREAAELCRVLARRRAQNIAVRTLTGVRLDLRIERLFETIREGEERPPLNDLLRVFDGLAARILTRRLWLVVFGLFTIVPAVASVALLAGQNRDMIEQNRVEEEKGYRDAQRLYTEILLGEIPQQANVDGEIRLVELPKFHRRLRAEAFETLVALEKQRWTEEERNALPPTRYVDLRNVDLRNLSLGGRIGLLDSKQRSDFSRVWLEGADLRGTEIQQSETEGSNFRNVRAQGAKFSCGSSVGADFSGIDATGALFASDVQNVETLDFQDAKFDGATLRDAGFFHVMFTRASLVKTDFTGCVFELCTFMECDLTQAELGGIDWSSVGLHKSLVTDEQFTEMNLPPYCHDEPGDVPGTRRIMSNPEEYMKWYEQREVDQQAAMEKELQEIREREERRAERAAEGNGE